MRPIPRKRMQKRPHMTIYPLEFHRRTEQRWARRAELSRNPRPCGIPACSIRMDFLARTSVSMARRPAPRCSAGTRPRMPIEVAPKAQWRAPHERGD